MFETTIETAADLNRAAHLKPLLALLALAALAVTCAPGSAWADHPCSADPSWPDGQLCNTDPSWPAGQNGTFYDPNCEQDGDPIVYSALCMQEGEIACNPGGGSGCPECWDCIDNDNDGLFDCMDNLDGEGNVATGGGCGSYCEFINPLGTSGGYNQDQDGDGFLACPLGPPSPAPSIYDCDDSDPNVHSGATEVCDDGIDNDCDGQVDGADPDCGGSGDDDDSGASSDDDDSVASSDDDDSGSLGDDDTVGDDGCACSSTASATTTGAGLVLAVLLVGVCRRRAATG